MRYKLGRGLSFRSHLTDCLDDKQISEWMIFKDQDYSLDMLVYPVLLDDWDLDDEEHEELESLVLSENCAGNLLNTDQLVDIVTNLKSQKRNITDSELKAAINYYSKHDAFIQL